MKDNQTVREWMEAWQVPNCPITTLQVWRCAAVTHRADDDGVDGVDGVAAKEKRFDN